MAASTELTQKESILLVALDYEEKGCSQFTAENLAVWSWKEYPTTFGLKGYECDYPDFNKVITNIMGERGLVRRGWLTKLSPKFYCLSVIGRTLGQTLRQKGKPVSVREKELAVPPLSQEHEKLLMGLLASTACTKNSQNHRNEITFVEATDFWGNYYLRGDAFKEQIQRISDFLTHVVTLVKENTVTLPSQLPFNIEHAQQLLELCGYLTDTFRKRIEAMCRLSRPRIAAPQ